MQGVRVMFDVVFQNHFFSFSSQHRTFYNKDVYITYEILQGAEKPFPYIAMFSEISSMQYDLSFRFDFEPISLKSGVGNIIRSYPDLSFYIYGNLYNKRPPLNGRPLVTFCLSINFHHIPDSVLLNCLRQSHYNVSGNDLG